MIGSSVSPWRAAILAAGLLGIGCGTAGLGECVEHRLNLNPIKSFISYHPLGEMTSAECRDLCNANQRECDWRRSSQSVVGP
jgi:hypothetical protein